MFCWFSPGLGLSRTFCGHLRHALAPSCGRILKRRPSPKRATHQAGCCKRLFCFPAGGTTAPGCGFRWACRPWLASCPPSSPWPPSSGHEELAAEWRGVWVWHLGGWGCLQARCGDCWMRNQNAFWCLRRQNGKRQNSSCGEMHFHSRHVRPSGSGGRVERRHSVSRIQRRNCEGPSASSSDVFCSRFPSEKVIRERTGGSSQARR